MNNIPNLVENKNSCCGCQACGNVCPTKAITFKADEYGFSYPVIDENKCIGCNKCVKTCDFQRGSIVKKYPKKSFAAVHKNKIVLAKSSSGGVFSALADFVFKQDGVVCGCIFDEDMFPVHTFAKNEVELEKMRGSKYVQSNIGTVYKQIKEKLEEGVMVLFTGTPCQVAGLYAVLGNKEYKNLLTADLICHGVPSPKIFRDYLDVQECKYKGKISNLHFRSKNRGWGELVQTFCVDGAGKKRKYVRDSREDFYYTNFRKKNIFRSSCYECRYACPERVSDVTIGDFWGYKKAKLHLRIDGGLSVCLANTDKGIQALYKCELQLEEVPREIAIEGNGQLNFPAEKGVEYEKYMKKIATGKLEELVGEFYQKHKKEILIAKIRRLIPSKLYIWLKQVKRRLKG